MNPFPNMYNIPQQKLNRTLSTSTIASNDSDDDESSIRLPNFLKYRTYLSPSHYLENEENRQPYIFCSSSSETDPLINTSKNKGTKNKWWNNSNTTNKDKDKNKNKWSLSPLIAYEEDEKRRETRRNYLKAVSPFLFFFCAGEFITMNVYDSFFNPRWWNMYGRALNPLFGPGQATLMRFGMHSNAKWSILTNIFVLPHLPAIILLFLNIPCLVRLECSTFTSWKDVVGLGVVSFVCSSFAIFVGEGAGGAIYPLLVLSFHLRKKETEIFIWITLWVMMGITPFFSLSIQMLSIGAGILFGWISRREDTWTKGMAIIFSSSIAFLVICLYAWNSNGCKLGHVYANEMCVQSCFWKKGNDGICDYSCLEIQGKDVEIYSNSEDCELTSLYK